MLDFFQKTLNEPVSLFTAILAVSTIGLWLVTGLQGRRQKRQLRTLERAFIIVEPGGIRPFGSDPRIACDVVINNTGNLPATKLKWLITKTYSGDPHEKNFNADQQPLVGSIVIAPRSKARKGSDPTDQATFHANREGRGPYEAYLYVWGRVGYNDGFVDGRYIDFCHRYNLHGAQRFEIPAENARYHEYGNRTDIG